MRNGRWASFRLVCRIVPRFRTRNALTVIAVAAITVLAAPPAWATPVPTLPGSSPRAGSPTQMVMSGTGAGQGVTGFIADAGNSFDPAAEGYPTSNPMTEASANTEGFAGIIYGRATDGSNTQLSLYCFEMNAAATP